MEKFILIKKSSLKNLDFCPECDSGRLEFYRHRQLYHCKDCGVIYEPLEYDEDHIMFWEVDGPESE